MEMILCLGSKFCVQTKKLDIKAFNIMLNIFEYDVRVKHCVHDYIWACDKPDVDLHIKNASKKMSFVPRNIEGALNRFATAMKKEFQSRNGNNSTILTKEQEKVMHYFMNHRECVMLQTDKNLGP